MKWSESLIPTLKETPADAEVASHILMMRAGLIRKLSAGAYSYLPLGLKTLKKAEQIVREEMNAKGAQEVLLPAIHPADIWKKTGRYELLGEVMIKFKDRTGRESVLGPTHEEIITDLVAGNVRSYKDLPLTLYQIQTKFRDEARPRFGILRSKEFIMKDAYSFDCDVEGLNKSYKKMYEAYCRIFDRCGLKYIAVEADPGFMGGDVSHEFMVPSESGEDEIIICSSCGYAASSEKAECIKGPKNSPTAKQKALKEVDTPNVSTIEKVSELLKQPHKNMVKTLIYVADGKPVAFLIRGDNDLNEAKARRFLGCDALEMADEGTIKKVTGGPTGFSGPVGLKGTRIIADYNIEGITDFVTGANKKDKHFINVNIKRDFEVKEWADIRYITESDKCPKCKKKIQIKYAIEVGHTFKLGTKYSKTLEAKFLDKQGKEQIIIMGCYGIGVNRILAAAIEQNNDKDGISWPASIAPYEALVLPVDMADKKIVQAAEKIYKDLKKAGVDVLLDDRDLRAGIKFKDADLIGVPLQIVIGKKALAKGKIEFKTRSTGKTTLVGQKDILKNLRRR